MKYFLTILTLQSGYCVVDLCEDDFCAVETTNEVVIVERIPEYEEGAIVECPHTGM